MSLLVSNVNRIVEIACSPFQEAVARIIEKEITRFEEPTCVFKVAARNLLPKRDLMVRKLQAAGMPVIVPEGGFFMLADISKVGEEKKEGGKEGKRGGEGRKLVLSPNPLFTSCVLEQISLFGPGRTLHVHVAASCVVYWPSERSCLAGCIDKRRLLRLWT